MMSSQNGSHEYRCPTTPDTSFNKVASDSSMDDIRDTVLEIVQSLEANHGFGIVG